MAAGTLPSRLARALLRRWPTLAPLLTGLRRLLIGPAPEPQAAAPAQPRSRPLTGAGAPFAPGVRLPGVRVVIPTRNAAPLLRQLLERLAGQTHLQRLEILVIDSGSRDATLTIAREAGARVLSIDPAAFGHGRTRNLGLADCTLPYLLFLTQDALPVGTELLARLVRLLEDTPAAAAASCRQLPYGDASRLACWMLDNHRQFLGLFGDRLAAVGDTDFDRLPPLEQRQLCLLDHVCTLYRTTALRRWPLADVPFAEDLLAAATLLRAGQALAYLDSGAVIHSHNRPGLYHLRRMWHDSQASREFLGLTPPQAVTDDRELAAGLASLYPRLAYQLAQDAEPLAAAVTESPEQPGPDTDEGRWFARLASAAGGARPVPALDRAFFELFGQFAGFCARTDAPRDEDYRDSVLGLFCLFAGGQLAARLADPRGRDAALAETLRSALAEGAV
jgi:rhamnosyltransferase